MQQDAHDWKQATLGGVVDLISGGTPSKRRADYWNGTFPWVSAKDMKQFRISDTEDHLTEDGVENGTRIAPSGSVLLLTRGMTLLHNLPVCVIKRPMAFNQDVKALRPTEAVDDEFLPYLILGNRHRLLRMVDLAGHGTGRLNSDELRALDFSLPPLAEQRAIARVLGALDDKIELNRRMSETLEEMARALFRSWFVDFDPVRAKAEGRPSGLPPDLDALFPASFEASGLGEIPAGWEVKTLGDVAVDRRVAVSPEAIAPETPYIGLDHMPRRSIALSEWSTAEGLASNKSSFEQGDILFGKLRPYFHKVGVAPVGGVCSTDIVVLSPKSSEWFGFVLGHASSDEFVNYTDAVSTGTKMPRTKWKDMARYGVPAPREALVAAFNERAQACVTRIATAIHESRVLAGERDALLPRLVSGEYRVSRGDGVPK